MTRLMLDPVPAPRIARNPLPAQRRPYDRTELPVRSPDRRRLRGWPTPAGILWRDLERTDRAPLSERTLIDVVLNERALAEASLERSAELDARLT